MPVSYVGDLYVEITNKCNLFCKHCYNSSSAINNRYINRDSFLKIVDSAANSGIKSIALSGGEPLLNPEIIEILKDISNKKMKCSIVTNGTLVSKYFLEQIHEYKDMSFQISLHGSNAEIHSRLTGCNSFDRIIYTMELLNSFGISFTIKSTITKYNMSDIENIILLGKMHGAKGTSASFLQMYGRTVDFYNEISIDDISLTQFYVQRFTKIVEKYKGYFTGPIVENTRCPLIFGGNSEEKTYQIAPRVDVYGYVYPCAMFINPRYNVGNIFANTFEEIFSSDRFYDLINYIELREKYVNKCTKCIVSSVCGKGCPASAMEADMLSTNAYCTMFKWKILEDAIGIM